MRHSFHTLVTALCLLVATTLSDAAVQKNGFDLSGSLIPVDEIHSGGPPRDGIPAIDRPKFLPAAKAHELRLSVRESLREGRLPIAFRDYDRRLNSLP